MSVGLSPGTHLPDFELRDDAGIVRRLSDLQGDDLMVVRLGRGGHCPRERQHQRSMVEFHGCCAVALELTRRVRGDYDPTMPEARTEWERSQAAAFDAAGSDR